MASIQGKTEERVFRTVTWKGLNESPDGDVKLEAGEAAASRNFRVTRDGALQRRPGLDLVLGLLDGYEEQVDEEETIVRTDPARFPSLLRMFSSVTVTADGFIEMPEEEPDLVTDDNWEDYPGWYWRHNKHSVWKFVRLDFNAETDQWEWVMRRVRAAADVDSDPSVTGLWTGRVAGEETVLAVCCGYLFRLWTKANGFQKTKLGQVYTGDSDGPVPHHIFSFGDKVYVQNGHDYMEWNGTVLKAVEGYVPLVSVAIAGTSGGTTLEQINKLTGKRRVWISPDGTETVFGLPEKGIKQVDYVKDLATGTSLTPTTDYTADKTNGTVTFSQAPAAAVNSYEIGYTMETTATTAARTAVLSMKYSEIFNGTNDNRLFLYGDGTNKALYSGLDYDGNARADYFPDMNVLVVGSDEAPVTSMVRHSGKLLAYKRNACWQVSYNVTVYADGSVGPSYYLSPVHRELGSETEGPVPVVNNAPVTVCGAEVYTWAAAGYYNNTATDERYVKRVSDRVYRTMKEFRRDPVCWDDNEGQEFYVLNGEKALVWNYAADAWSYYTEFPVTVLCRFHGDLYAGCADGNFCLLDYENRTDNGETIACYWESGSIPFDREYMRKYSAAMWIGLKPEYGSRVNVTCRTDRKGTYAEKKAVASLASFAGADYRHWSFRTNRMPHETRMKIKAKKMVFDKLIMEMDDERATATLLNADLRIRYTGYAKGR